MATVTVGSIRYTGTYMYVNLCLGWGSSIISANSNHTFIFADI